MHQFTSSSYVIHSTIADGKRSELRYRPEIDGLRAIAVLSVLFFHAGLGFPGGYVGVDVFFVISGYLITSLILRDLEKGSFSIVDFWERRIRRIMPALAAVVAFVLIVGSVVLFPNELENLGKSAVALAVFSSNVFFWRASGYFSGEAEEKPLLHTWSLAVEEQFYLVFPILLILLFKVPFFRNRMVLLWVLSVLAAASFLASVVGVYEFPSGTFYLLPTRAWELLMGSILAVLPASITPKSLVTREFLAWAGGIMLIASVFLYSPDTRFPGAAALPPCLGTALVILVNGETRPTSLGRLLGLKWVVFFGLISYSLYLWHWPLFSFTQNLLMTKPDLSVRCFLVFLSVVLATLSWKYLETPFRKRWLLKSERSIFGTAAGYVVILLLAGGIFWKTQGLPGRLGSKVSQIFHDSRIEPLEYRTTAEDIDLENLVRVGKSDGSPIDFLIWGDSHAAQAVPAFEAFAKLHGLSGTVVSYSSTAPLANYHRRSLNGLDQKAPEWAAAVVKFVQRNSVKNVILISHWKGEFEGAARSELSERISETALLLRKAGAKVFLMIQVPEHERSIPRLLARKEQFNINEKELLTKPREHSEESLFFYELVASNPDEGLVLLDPSKYFLDDSGEAFVVEKEGVPLYIDNHHLTESAAVEYLLPMLEEQYLKEMKE